MTTDRTGALLRECRAFLDSTGHRGAKEGCPTCDLMKQIDAALAADDGVRVPREQLARWLEALQWEQGGEPIGTYTANAITELKAMLAAAPKEKP